VPLHNGRREDLAPARLTGLIWRSCTIGRASVAGIPKRRGIVYRCWSLRR